MNARGLLVCLVLVPFLAATLALVADVGVTGFYREVASSPVGIQVFVDLAIALGLVLIWMRTDAREHGLPYFPYVVVTLAIGSVGPLAYLLHREVRRALRPIGERPASTPH